MTLQNLVLFKCIMQVILSEKIGWEYFPGETILADQVCWFINKLPFESNLKPGSSESKSSDKLHILTGYEPDALAGL